MDRDRADLVLQMKPDPNRVKQWAEQLKKA